MRYEHIRQLLETELKKFVTAHNETNNKDVKLSYENVSFDPPAGTNVSYIKSQLVPNTKRPVAIGSNPQELIRGLFVVTPYTPSDKGPLQADSLADEILNTVGFRATDVLSNSNGAITIEYSERNQGFLEAPWYYVPIFIAWRVFKQ